MHLFETSNSIGPRYNTVLLFSGLEYIVLLFIVFLANPVRGYERGYVIIHSFVRHPCFASHSSLI